MHDTNQHFWNYIFECTQSSLEITDFFYPNLNPQILANLVNCLNSWSEEKWIPLEISGPAFSDEIVRSSKRMLELQQVPQLLEETSEFLRYLCRSGEIQLDQADVVSLGVNSQQSLAFAVIFGEVLRREFPGKFKVILGKHDYENFSLALKRNEIERTKHLFTAFDLICFKPENFVVDLIEFMGGISSPSQMSELSVDFLLKSSKYLNKLVVEPEQTVYFMPLSRNRCYWNKCTFCVQIKKHTPGLSYENDSELKLSLEIISVLRKNGIKYFIFSDEAVSPKILRAFCEELEEQGLKDLNWTVRIIADVGFDRELIEKMAKMGCREVLFGLETVSQETSSKMGKVSKSSSPAKIEDLLRAFSNQGIGLFVNFIYGFPTERNEDFEITFEFYKKLRASLSGLTVQFNKFGLFTATDIFKDPKRFEIIVHSPAEEDDLVFLHEYQDKFGRSSQDLPNEKYFMESLGGDPVFLENLRMRPDLMNILFSLGYMSFGFIYKCDTGQSLIQKIAV
jgi:hypothetical protein